MTGRGYFRKAKQKLKAQGGREIRADSERQKK